MTLDSALRDRKIGDSDLGAACNPPIHRTLIWAYRKRRKMPRADTALAILAALKKFGIEMTLDQLLSRPRRSRAA